MRMTIPVKRRIHGSGHPGHIEIALHELADSLSRLEGIANRLAVLDHQQPRVGAPGEHLANSLEGADVFGAERLTTFRGNNAPGIEPLKHSLLRVEHFVQIAIEKNH